MYIFLAIGRERVLLPRAEAPADDPLEGEAEVLGEQGIDHGIHGRVAVAQPEEHREEQRIHAVLAEWPDDVHGEEGAPAEDEHPDDDGQCLGRLGFHAEALHLGLDVPPAHLLVGRTRVSRSPSLAGVALPPGQLRQTLAHLQVAGAGSSVLLLLPVQLGFSGLPTICSIVVDGKEGIARWPPLVTTIPMPGQLVDVLAGGIGHRDLDLVMMMQPSSGVFG